MLTITAWEVQELIDQLELRHTSWSSDEERRLWVRRCNGVQQFALKVLNGLPRNMSEVHVKALSESFLQSDAELHVHRLLMKLTSYGQRRDIVLYLSRHTKLHQEAIEQIAFDLSDPTFAIESGEERALPEAKKEKVVSIIERSKYLRDLLK